MHDRKLAFQRFMQACELGAPEGCNNAGRAFAIKLFDDQVCAYILVDHNLSRTPGMILRKGTEGIPEDSKHALTLFERACSDGVRNACYLASVVHLKGAVVVLSTNH